MSDFFSGLYSGIRTPEVLMQEGPLPPASMVGMPGSLNGTDAAKINQSATLLGDLNPYAYAAPSHLSTQQSYLNIPHRVQKIIPQIHLPDEKTSRFNGDFMKISHQVQDGDVAFVCRAMFSPFDMVSDKKKFARQGVLFAIDPIMNLASLNYCLHGLQRYGFDPEAKNWHTLWTAFQIDDYFSELLGENFSARMLQTQKHLDELQKQMVIQDNGKYKGVSDDNMKSSILAMSILRTCRKLIANYIIRNVITPLGVPSGSDEQGGQHQGINNKAVTWPVDFVTSIIVDGKCTNMLNYWKKYNISAGDDLIFMLQEGTELSYTHSHHFDSMRTVTFEPLNKWEVPAVIAKYKGSKGALSNSYKRLWDIFAELAFSERTNEFGEIEPKDKNETPMPIDGYNPKKRPRDMVTASKKDARMVLDFIYDSMDETDALEKIEQKLKGSQLVAQIYKNANKTVTAMEKRSASGIERRRAPVVMDEPIFQLVPAVSSSTENDVIDAVWRHGYWHIARSHVMHYQYDMELPINSNANHMNRGKPLNVTFAPVWVEGHEAVGLETGGDHASAFSHDDMDDFFTRPEMKRMKKRALLNLTEKKSLGTMKESETLTLELICKKFPDYVSAEETNTIYESSKEEIVQAYTAAVDTLCSKGVTKAKDFRQYAEEFAYVQVLLTTHMTAWVPNIDNAVLQDTKKKLMGVSEYLSKNPTEIEELKKKLTDLQSVSNFVSEDPESMRGAIKIYYTKNFAGFAETFANIESAYEGIDDIISMHNFFEFFLPHCYFLKKEFLKAKSNKGGQTNLTELFNLFQNASTTPESKKILCETVYKNSEKKVEAGFVMAHLWNSNATTHIIYKKNESRDASLNKISMDMSVESLEKYSPNIMNCTRTYRATDKNFDIFKALIEIKKKEPNRQNAEAKSKKSANKQPAPQSDSNSGVVVAKSDPSPDSDPPQDMTQPLRKGGFGKLKAKITGGGKDDDKGDQE